MRIPRHLRYWRCVLFGHDHIGIEDWPGSYRCARCKQTRRLFG